MGEKYLLCSQTPQDDIEILQVKMTLEKLPEEQRELLILKYSGYTYEEIAKRAALFSFESALLTLINLLS